MHENLTAAVLAFGALWFSGMVSAGEPARGPDPAKGRTIPPNTPANVDEVWNSFFRRLAEAVDPVPAEDSIRARWRVFAR
jgi:hypothetical protein